MSARSTLVLSRPYAICTSICDNHITRRVIQHGDALPAILVQVGHLALYRIHNNMSEIQDENIV